MKRIFIIIAFLGLAIPAAAQNVQSCRSVRLRFFSSAPLEDIEAMSTQGVSAINPATRAIYFKVPITSFQFKKKLMQEHFNENYLESDKFPYAEFKGRVLGTTDLTKDGTWPVEAEGDLQIHGVTKSYRVSGTITIAGGNLAAEAKFKVRVADHNIKIPSLVIKNIAEVVEVTMSAQYQPAVKP
ncbi:YceI family protein [Chitinophaga rhizosphaerae]|uniref:YceI family protein n=1 Tax=Chitinophaga rhizosphaerae TaxID=1864947 RepID=UPI000F8048DE|nr:YceI family protein [Chitinophaga rhizosphaerae]